jgi:PAS domain S-box-containing protein
LQPAIEQAGDAVMITTPEVDDVGPTILYVNPAMTRLTGYTAEELLGGTPRLLRGPRTDPAVLERMRAALAAGRDFTTTLVHYRKDGTEDVVEWHVSPIRNDSRRVTHLLCIQRDVHDRWESEQRIAARIDRARAEYAAAFQSLPELCFRLAGDGTILDYQATAPESLYLPPEAFLHRRMQEVLPPEIGEMTSAAIAEALQSRETVVRRYTLPIGGQPQLFEARHVPLPGNEVLAMVRSIGEETEPTVQ